MASIFPLPVLLIAVCVCICGVGALNPRGGPRLQRQNAASAELRNSLERLRLTSPDRSEVAESSSANRRREQRRDRNEPDPRPSRSEDRSGSRSRRRSRSGSRGGSRSRSLSRSGSRDRSGSRSGHRSGSRSGRPSESGRLSGSGRRSRSERPTGSRSGNDVPTPGASRSEGSDGHRRHGGHHEQRVRDPRGQNRQPTSTHHSQHHRRTAGASSSSQASSSSAAREHLSRDTQRNIEPPINPDEESKLSILPLFHGMSRGKNWSELSDRHKGRLDKELKCSICQDKLRDSEQPVVEMSMCTHVYHQECIQDSFANYAHKCPECRVNYGIGAGRQPRLAKMEVTRKADVYEINYTIPRGREEETNKRYSGAHFTAYLPRSDEATKVLTMLKIAFRMRRVFRLAKRRGGDDTYEPVFAIMNHITNRAQFNDKSLLKAMKAELHSIGIMDGDVRMK